MKVLLLHTNTASLRGALTRLAGALGKAALGLRLRNRTRRLVLPWRMHVSISGRLAVKLQRKRRDTNCSLSTNASEYIRKLASHLNRMPEWWHVSQQCLEFSQ